MGMNMVIVWNHMEPSPSIHAEHWDASFHIHHIIVLVHEILRSYSIVWMFCLYRMIALGFLMILGAEICRCGQDTMRYA